MASRSVSAWRHSIGTTTHQSDRHTRLQRLLGDARAALRAADLALFVVSGVDGVEVQTEQLWRVAEEEGIPRAVVVTKLDRDRSSFERTLDQLRESFGKAIAPIQVPIGSEEGLRGSSAWPPSEPTSTRTGEKSGKEVDLPSEVEDLVHAAHTALVETVVETDDEMMEAYFEGKEPTREQIVATVHNGMLAGEIYPVLVASAERYGHRPARRVHRRLRAQPPGTRRSPP